jgi:hypothetical protein|tara:strand:+ start:7007 stop:7216 length:210 start_codon:yes stop_codon:yes gene_type:complete
MESSTEIKTEPEEKILWKEKKKTYFRDWYRKKHVGKTMICACGKHIATGSLRNHLKSKYHLRVMEAKQQ